PLTEGQTLSGRLLDETDRAVAEASVTLILPQALAGPRVVPEALVVQSDAEGRWRCKCVPKDVTYVFIEVAHPDFDAPTGQADLDELRAGTAALKLSAVATVSGQVLDEAGHPVPNAELLLGRERDIWPNRMVLESRSDSAGRFEFRRVHLEKRLLGAHAPGFA